MSLQGDKIAGDDKMKIVVSEKVGGAEVLKVTEFKRPKPAHGEVLIAVRSMTVKNHDILRRQDKHHCRKKNRLGYDCCGTVVGVGDGVTKFNENDDVCALLEEGVGYAEYVVVHEKLVVRAPRFIRWDQCAGLPYAGTALVLSLFISNPIRAGQNILIHGGAGGLGSLAIQICKNSGLEVFVTVESKEQQIFCYGLKADVCFNNKFEKYGARVLDKTRGLGVNYILDCSDRENGEDIHRDIECLAKNGRLIIMGSKLRYVELDLHTIADLTNKGIRLTGSYFALFSDDTIEELLVILEKKIWPEVEKYRVRPSICKTFDLDEVEAAHILMESKAHMGRIVLTTSRFGSHEERTKDY